jgi:hypothetical protein
MAAASWIFQIPITFKPLDRSFRNLVAIFGLLPARIFQKFKMLAAGWQPSWIFEISITFKQLDRSFLNLLPNFGPKRAVTRNFQIKKNAKWQPQTGGHLGFLK